MAVDFYTDQILDDNFHRIIDFNNDVLDTIQSLTTLAERTEMRLNVLEKLSSRPVVVKSSKLLILTAMAVSAYAGYKYAEAKFKEEIEFERERELDRNIADHPAGSRKTDYTTGRPEPKIPDQHDVKINGSNDPRPES
jgi:hypothetical protein